MNSIFYLSGIQLKCNVLVGKFITLYTASVLLSGICVAIICSLELLKTYLSFRMFNNHVRLGHGPQVQSLDHVLSLQQRITQTAMNYGHMQV